MKILLLPGLDGTGLLFKPLLNIIPEKIDVTVISYTSDECLDYSQLSDLVISQLPNEDFILVAESFSGYIAYQIGLKKPKHLKSIIFVATFICNPRPFLLNFSQLLPMNTLLKLPMPNIIIYKYLLGRSTSNETIKLVKNVIKQVDTKVLKFRLKLMTTINNPKEKCHIESIYIQASEDKLINNRFLEPFKKTFSNLIVHKVKGPHFLLQSNPQDCFKIIRDQLLSVL